MIALQHQTLLICFSDGNIEPLHLRDLVPHILESLPKEKGLLPPWMVESALESVIGHFRNELGRQTVSLGEFLMTARSLLASFIQETSAGCKPTFLDHPGEIHHPPGGPFHPEKEGKLDLFLTAKGCGSGFELDFFRKVRNFLGQTGQPSAKNIPPIQFTGLRSCAKFIAGRRRWSKRCAEVRDEIVSFIRQEMLHKEEEKSSAVIHS